MSGLGLETSVLELGLGLETCGLGLATSGLGLDTTGHGFRCFVVVRLYIIEKLAPHNLSTPSYGTFVANLLCQCHQP